MELQVKEILKSKDSELMIKPDSFKSPYKTNGSFEAITREMSRKGNILLMKIWFAATEYLLHAGCANVKLVIDNIYLFSVTSFLDLTGSVSWQVKDLLPSDMKAEYHKQVNSAY